MSASPATPPATPPAAGSRRRASDAPAPPWLEWLTRAGYVAKGILYVLIGGTGLLVAFGLAEEARGSREAIRLVASLPMGRLLIAALAVGLAGYSFLSFVAAMRAPEGSRDLSGLPARVADGVAGIVYAALVALALALLADPQASTRVASEQWAARIMAVPGGALLLGGAGVVVSGAALYLAWKAAVAPIVAQFERRRVPAARLRAVVALARLGIAARAVLFALCGWLLLNAGVTGEPQRVGGLGRALDALAAAPAGRAVVGVVAAGCVAYGVYQLAKARWRRMRFEVGEQRAVS